MTRFFLDPVYDLLRLVYFFSAVKTINELLPGLKELTAAVEEHWINMIHQAISEGSKTGIPQFKKAFVMLEITTPRGNNDPKVRDTANRDINVIINNFKGMFFKVEKFINIW